LYELHLYFAKICNSNTKDFNYVREVELKLKYITHVTAMLSTYIHREIPSTDITQL